MLRYVGVVGLAVVLWGCQTASSGGQRPVESTDIRDYATARTDGSFLDDADCFQFAIVADRTGGLRPGVFAEAVRKLNLLRPIYLNTAVYGHFGREEDLDIFTWERTDKIQALQELAGK